MRYTRIELEGDAGNFAVLARKSGSGVITAEVIKPSGTSAVEINVVDADQRAKAPGRLHQAVEGYRGTQGDIAPYAIAIELLADQ